MGLLQFKGSQILLLRHVNFLEQFILLVLVDFDLLLVAHNHVSIALPRVKKLAPLQFELGLRRLHPLARPVDDVRVAVYLGA